MVSHANKLCNDSIHKSVARVMAMNALFLNDEILPSSVSELNFCLYHIILPLSNIESISNCFLLCYHALNSTVSYDLCIMRIPSLSVVFSRPKVALHPCAQYSVRNGVSD